MKKNNITLGLSICTLAFSSTLLTSCIDDQVSEEVKEIRQAQAAVLRAEANETNAEVAALEASTALQNLEQEIIAIRNKAEEEKLLSDNELALANNQNQIDLLAIQSQIDKASAENNLNQELENIQTDLRQKGLDDIAEAYDAYAMALMESQAMQEEKISIEIDILRKELDIAQATTDADFAKEAAQEIIDKRTAEIETKTASLEVLKAADTNFPSIETEIETAEAEKAVLETDAIPLNIEIENATRAFEEAKLDFLNVTDPDELTRLTNKLTVAMDVLDDATSARDINDANIMILQTLIDNLQKLLEDETGNLDTEIEELEDEIVELRKDIDAANADTNNLDVNLATLDRDLTVLQNSLDLLTTNIDNLTIEIAEKKDIYDTLVADLP